MKRILPGSFLLHLLLPLLFWLASSNTQARANLLPVPKTCEYQETTGSETRHFVWSLEKESAWLLTSEDGLETHKAWLDNKLGTYKWTLERPETATKVKAWLEGQILHIQGTHDGKAYDRKHKLGSDPWYQALSLSLRRHLGEGGQAKQHQKFWLIRPDNFDLHRMQISLIQEESLKISESVVPTYRVEIRPTGWKAPFWKGEYWFRKSDGDFVRFRGDSAPPGCPPTFVEPMEQKIEKSRPRETLNPSAMKRTPY